MYIYKKQIKYFYQRQKKNNYNILQINQFFVDLIGSVTLF